MSTPAAGSAGYPVRNVSFDAPWEWLGAGWRDLWRVWPISLAYGAVFAVVALALLVGLFVQDGQAVIVALAAGFLLLGPILAVGLYEASRRLLANEPVTFGAVAFVRTASPLQLAYLGVVLTLLFLFWVKFAMLLFALFLGQQAFPPLTQLPAMLLLTVDGVGLLVVGTALGAALAVAAFALSAMSVPLLMHKRTDFFTAIATSIKALTVNPRALLLWAGLIAALMVLGMATVFVGFIIAFPLIGHATWHAYRAVVVTDD
ncbi:MAG: DUF2189 domain-containing protein [Alphaproteobacteria bacterium]|nr:DUF2189 domain-containing protein [Alphaproteobacteria bacterium]MCB9931275.1 DUF2189 domain-containing protein [Alphaproteobacteria bacterium]